MISQQNVNSAPYVCSAPLILSPPAGVGGVLPISGTNTSSDGIKSTTTAGDGDQKTSDKTSPLESCDLSDAIDDLILSEDNR